MKKFHAIGLGLLVCCVGVQTHASLVYEGFDYTDGSAVVGQGTGDGWDGDWALGGGSNPPLVTDGLSLGSVSGVGGAAQRPNRAGNGAINRTISSASQGALTGDGSTIYFSVLMRTFAGSTGSGTTDGFALNSWGTVVLGDATLTGGHGSHAAPIASGGNAVGVGFAGTGGGGDFANIRVQGVTYTGGTYTENDAQRITVGDATVMIVGRVDWAANGSDDIVTLYNVTDPSAPLPAAFSTMSVDLDQTGFNVVSIGDAQTSVIDEVRFDTTLEGVIPEPATLGLVVVFGTGLLLLRRRFKM